MRRFTSDFKRFFALSLVFTSISTATACTPPIIEPDLPLKTGATATPQPSSSPRPTASPVLHIFPPPNPNTSLTGKTEKDISAKRETYVYKIALPNVDFSKLLYAYDTTEEVDFKDSNGLSARRIWYSGLWLYDRTTGQNEKLPAELQLGSEHYPGFQMLWLDQNRVLAMGNPVDTATINAAPGTPSLFILDLAKKQKEVVSTRKIAQYFVQGPFIYYLAESQLYQYNLQTGSTKPMPLPPVVPEFSSNTYAIYPHQGDQILIKKTKLISQKGKYDFSVQLSPPAPNQPVPLLDYYLYNTQTFQASLLPGAADISSGLSAASAVLFSPDLKRYVVLNQIHEGAKVLPTQVKGSPYLWITDQLVLSVDFIQEVPGGPPNAINKVSIFDIATGLTRLETAMPKSCYSLYKAQHNRILAQCGDGQVYHLSGTPEQPGQFLPLFAAPTYASLGPGNGSQGHFSEQAPIFVAKQGENHYADIVGLSASGEPISKFKLLPPEKPDFVFEAPTTPWQTADQWQAVYDKFQR